VLRGREVHRAVADGRVLPVVPPGGLRERNIDAIPGSPPDLRRLPPGCSFAPRCPRRAVGCRRAVPEPRFPEPGHMAACFAVTGALGPPS